MAAAIITAVGATPAAAQSVGVTLNGTPVSLSPAPETRAGRVFVPLRGIFERLGASVVYANGTINAQGNGRAISLHVGSTQATVNGQPQNLDVAPFIIGASTYVPLRFVSQALGATVNYDGTNHVVAISNGGASQAAPAMQATPMATQAAASPLRLGNIQPGRGVSVAARRPEIEAQFTNGSADPNSLHVSLDQLDITASTSRSPSGFVYSPPSDLQSGAHMVRVTGKDSNGAPFQLGWRFESGTSAVVNFLTNLTPAEGATVGRQFTVHGKTLPGAQVVVQVGSTNGGNTVAGQIGAILGLGGGASVRNEVTANADGTFATVIGINAAPGATLQMVVSSTDARTKAAAPPINRTLTVQ